MDLPQRLAKFVTYAESCHDERGQAQVFCDRLFQAFGHDGYMEAGAVLEDRVKMSDGKTRFADLVWRPRLLLEMKKRGEKLGRHYTQALRYWERLVPQRPRYVLLCNFEEIWIYDFSTQLDEPIDRMRLADLPERYTALNFMLPEEREPLFKNNRAAVTEEAASKLGALFRMMRDRGEPQDRAQRFLLQCVLALFAEDIELLPGGMFTGVVDDCVRGKGNAYDQIGALFQQMNSSTPARGGRFRDVRYFNGGLFETIEPVELKPNELQLLRDTCDDNWSRINPAIFGTLFQATMLGVERHKKGAHYTPEAEIRRVVGPCIVEPFTARINGAKTLDQLLAVRKDLASLQVLDPACGSGNFLYVAFREMARLEKHLVDRVHDDFGERSRAKVGAALTISTKQFFGLDMDSFAVELARVTLLLAKELALLEWRSERERTLGLDFDQALPLDNLENNVVCGDALFGLWPRADVIIGNPPFQPKNKVQAELGPAYMNKVRKKYPGVPGHADYCVYWFRRAHDELPAGGRAGLVGTNTIRQNKSREGGLDYIVANGGTITEAVSTQVWPGTAVVHVSIVNWIKGKSDGTKLLFEQKGDDVDAPWETFELPVINSALSPRVDVTTAKDLSANITPKSTFQGQTAGHREGFVIPVALAQSWIRHDAANGEVLFNYLIGDDLLDNPESTSDRLLLDFGNVDMVAASRRVKPFAHVKNIVLPVREAAEKRESERNAVATGDDSRARVNTHHANFLRHWWKLSFRREDMLVALGALDRYIVCSRVTRRPIFEFVSTTIRPGDALQVFALDDDYSFGLLQSDTHWKWFTERCSGLKIDPRYTSESVYSTFPWPQEPKLAQVRAVATAGTELRKLRRSIARKENIGLRQLYRLLDLPGAHPMKDAHRKLDDAVREAYGMKPKQDVLAFLLALNQQLAQREADDAPICGPGLPPTLKSTEGLVTDDCVRMGVEASDGRADEYPRQDGTPLRAEEHGLLHAAEPTKPRRRR